jgi:hypothetical protein
MNSTRGATSNLTSESHQSTVITKNTGHSIITQATLFGIGKPNFGLNRYPYPASTKYRAINTTTATTAIIIKKVLYVASVNITAKI